MLTRDVSSDATHHGAVERFTDNLETRVGPILTRVQILLDDTQPKISEMVADAAHVVYLARGQAQKLDRVVSEASDRLRGQLVAADRILTGALETVEEAGSQFKRGIWKPVQRVSAVVIGNQSRARLFALATRAGPTFLRRSRRTRRRTLHLRFRLNRASVQSHPNDFVGAGLAPPGVNLGSLQSGRSLHLLRNIISA